MLPKNNTLIPFFQNPEKYFSMRGYAKATKISTTKATKILTQLLKSTLIKTEKHSNYVCYKLNTKNTALIPLTENYWRLKLRNTMVKIKKTTRAQTMTLSENITTQNSEIKLIITCPLQALPDLTYDEQRLHKKITVIKATSFEKHTTENKNEILNGIRLYGKF